MLKINSLINNSSNSLLLNNYLFDYQYIKSINLDESKFKNLSNFERTTLLFCKEWLRGKTEFTVTTSGSSGLPHPIIFKRDQLIKSAKMTADFFDFQPKNKSLICIHTAYIGGIMMLVRGLEFGLAMTAVEPSSSPLISFPENTQFDLVAMVPLQLKQSLQNPKCCSILANIKTIIVGGAPVSDELISAVQKLKTPVFSTFGMTETASHFALRKLNGSDASDYYTVLPGTKIDLNSLGCLIVQSPVTDNKVIETTDLAEIIDEKRFRVLGRADLVINSGGIKVHPEKTEQLLLKLPEIQQLNRSFFIHKQPDVALGEAVVLVFEGDPIQKTENERLRALLKASLPAYHAPKEIYTLKKFEFTQTGKLNRKASFEKLF